ncbi:hypothetical protein GCM10018779_27850 [Streptomyces griseocarneus]|nr:hypothetical protein GCM10018779_27850 [Streptomyces griseocarneus]
MEANGGVVEAAPDADALAIALAAAALPTALEPPVPGLADREPPPLALAAGSERARGAQAGVTESNEYEAGHSVEQGGHRNPSQGKIQEAAARCR